MIQPRCASKRREKRREPSAALKKHGERLARAKGCTISGMVSIEMVAVDLRRGREMCRSVARLKPEGLEDSAGKKRKTKINAQKAREEMRES